MSTSKMKKHNRRKKNLIEHNYDKTIIQPGNGNLGLDFVEGNNVTALYVFIDRLDRECFFYECIH